MSKIKFEFQFGPGNGIFNDEIIHKRMAELITEQLSASLQGLDCVNSNHSEMETVIQVNDGGKSIRITDYCCTDFKDKLEKKLRGNS